ncbi:IspE: 4-diphosphocytidyl-2-C-methyl-D-erythritol kinase (CMK) [Desulfosarcina variabilis str. Montpellier]|uniref:4-(cytidine 5'-diphospho)-2-C-methyl-D-erythritol kinase n=1 Tax=Desulfosarcina variabilis TaxID=2300 RepID=UPI003AFA5226
MDPLVIKAPAKINLFLRIIGKRPDGYHDLHSLMCPVGLYDTLTLTFGQPEISVSCTHPDVPEDSTNLVVRAAAHFFNAAFAEPPAGDTGVQIDIQKQIPVGAGLGGGSSDAAAVLKALNGHWGAPLSTAELQRVGARIGADIPFFIRGGPAVAKGIGDRLEAFSDLFPYTAVLVYPNASVSTAWVYKNLNLRLTKDEKKLSNFHFDGRFFNIDKHLVNDLEPVTQRALPVISKIKGLLLANGAAGAMMSGSGSTVFGLFLDAEQADIAYQTLCSRSQNQAWTVIVANLLTN